jgi:hypothetical protein
VSVKTSARGSARSRLAPKKPCSIVARPSRGVVVCGREVGELEPGGEGERAQPRACCRERGERHSARACPLAEEPYEAGRDLGDLGMPLGGVDRVAVEELFELRPDRVRQLSPALAIGVCEQRRDRVRELERRAVRSGGPGLAALDGGEEVLRRVALGLRPRRCDIERAVVVGASGEGDSAGVHRFEAVPLRQLLEIRTLDRSRETARELVRLLRPGAVAAFPDPEQQHHPLDVRSRQRCSHPVERMRERVREPALAQERDQLVHGRAVRLQVAVVLLPKVPDEHVQRHGVLGELRRHLDGEKRPGLVRYPQRALDRVVVADRGEGHAARPAGPVDALGRGIRLA